MNAVSLQGVVVALMVAGCGAYAAWTLMPAAARRALATWLLRFPLPRSIAARCAVAARAASGCGCDGCDRSELKSAPRPGAELKSPPRPGAAQPITFHPRPHR